MQMLTFHTAATSRLAYLRECFSYDNSFIHSGYFYSASSSPLLLRSAPVKARMLCRSFMLKRHRQLRVKDLTKVPTWLLERDSNPRPSDQKASTLAICHHDY